MKTIILFPKRSLFGYRAGSSRIARARAYLEPKRAEGKSRREAIRCLKRLLVRVVFSTLKRVPPWHRSNTRAHDRASS